MDSVSQAALGAAVGYAVLGRRIGHKATLLGALGGTLPDLDVFLAPSSDVAFWQVHRGITHSLFFGPVVGAALAALSAGGERLWEMGRSRSAAHAEQLVHSVALVAWWRWWLFWTLVLVTHPMLDAMTTYGTQLLAPLNTQPFAVSAISIIDPVYTLTLLVGLLLAWLWRDQRTQAHRAALWALALSTAYIGISGSQNMVARDLARADATQFSFMAQPGAQMQAYTTIFTPWLRRVVAWTDTEVRVGFVSTLNPQRIRWTAYVMQPEAISAAQLARATPEGQVFYGFAKGPTLARLVKGQTGQPELRVSDARFGFPGDTLFGFWGLAMPMNGASGLVVGSGYRFTLPRSANRDSLNALWRAKLGLEQSAF